MARTAITSSALTANAAVANPSGTAVDPTNGHIISGSPLEEIYLVAAFTFSGAKNLTIKAGANPPALMAGQGDLVVAINNTTKLVGPFTSERFSQADGSLWVDVEASTTGTITVIRVPRSA